MKDELEEKLIEKVEVMISRHSPMPNFDTKEIFAREIVELLSTYGDAREKEAREEKEKLADALLDMYDQYCGDGHDFMSAGEFASSVLEEYGYATFDEVGRMTILSQPPKK